MFNLQVKTYWTSPVINGRCGVFWRILSNGAFSLKVVYFVVKIELVIEIRKYPPTDHYYYNKKKRKNLMSFKGN